MIGRFKTKNNKTNLIFSRIVDLAKMIANIKKDDALADVFCKQTARPVIEKKFDEFYLILRVPHVF